MDKMLSVVLPAYNEEQMIKKTAQVVGDLLEKPVCVKISWRLVKVSSVPNEKRPFHKGALTTSLAA